MNSFATNAVCAQDALCKKKSIKQAVDKMGKALEASESRNQNKTESDNGNQSKQAS